MAAGSLRPEPTICRLAKRKDLDPHPPGSLDRIVTSFTSPAVDEDRHPTTMDEEIARLQAELSQLKADQLPAVIGSPMGGQVLEQIDGKLAAGTPAEAAQWAQIRGAIIEQDQHVRDRQHRRDGEMLALKARIGMSAGAMAVGAGLVVGGLTLPGLFCLGAALYTIAPDYVMTLAKQFRGGGANDQL